MNKQIKLLIQTAILMIIGLVIFKYLPMYIWGEDILFDASSHIVWTSFGLYVIWFFIDQNKSWRIPYFIFTGAVLIIMAIQRVIAHQHNEVGIILGLCVAFFAIFIPRWKELGRKFKF